MQLADHVSERAPFSRSKLTSHADNKPLAADMQDFLVAECKYNGRRSAFFQFSLLSQIANRQIQLFFSLFLVLLWGTL